MTEEEWDRVRVATAFFALCLSLSLSLFMGGREEGSDGYRYKS
jgi:hypothetical protein